MAIEWEWSEKCGTATFEQDFDGVKKTYDVDLYVGNCLLIMIKEYKEDGIDKYSLNSFFVDEGHMKRCLENDIFTSDYDRLTDIRINKAKCRNWKIIVSLLTEYLDEINIKIYTEGERNWKEYKEAEPIIPDLRMREIAEKAVWAIHENGGDWEEELEYADLDLTEEEKEYFGIYTDEEDEDYEA